MNALTTARTFTRNVSPAALVRAGSPVARRPERVSSADLMQFAVGDGGASRQIGAVLILGARAGTSEACTGGSNQDPLKIWRMSRNIADSPSVRKTARTSAVTGTSLRKSTRTSRPRIFDAACS